jgi:rare lipoprotein A
MRNDLTSPAAVAPRTARGCLAIALLGMTALSLAQAPSSRLKVERPAQEIPAAETGIASVYSSDLEGELTASGQRYAPDRLTAAHRTLPLGTRLRVTDPATGKSVRVVVNDRWGGGPGRVVNLSLRAAEDIGLGSYGQLTVQVEVEKLGDGSVEPPEDEPVFREPLAPRLESATNDPAGRTRRCENEAEILGLRDQWRENHVRTCLLRKPAPPKR